MSTNTLRKWKNQRERQIAFTLALALRGSPSLSCALHPCGSGACGSFYLVLEQGACAQLTTMQLSTHALCVVLGERPLFQLFELLKISQKTHCPFSPHAVRGRRSAAYFVCVVEKVGGVCVF